MEKVLVFPESIVQKSDFTNGYINDRKVVSNYYLQIFSSKELQYISRDAAETDPRWKQIIPYNVIKLGGKYLVYQRSKSGGESRLHDCWSIGIGGHINEKDEGKTTRERYNEAWRRELEEEVDPQGVATNRIMAMLYDDSNAVGQVHFGIVHFVEFFYKSKFSFRDKSLTNFEWLNLDELKLSTKPWENWSKLVVNHIL